MSSSSAPSKLSFTIRRPTPVSRGTSSGGEDTSDSSTFKVPSLPKHLTAANGARSPLSRSVAPSPRPQSRSYADRDSSDEEDEPEDELVTGFDEFGVQRLREKKTEPQGPLVIPPLQNKDWRELARKRKALYVPPSAAAETGADGSVGGLGTRDTINSGPQVAGLQVTKRVKLEEDGVKIEEDQQSTTVASEQTGSSAKKEETEDEKALRAVLASAQSDDFMSLDGPHITAIPAPSEDDVYKQDVEELPEPATLEDYERVPVSQFGAALLRGMGWKEGTAANKKGKGPVEPYLPQARPALLGIGAKEKEVFDDGSSLLKGKKGGKGKPERRYVPVIKKERRAAAGEEDRSRERSREGSSAGALSTKRRSPSPERTSRRRSPSSERQRKPDSDRRYGDYDRDRERDRDRRKDDRRTQESSRRDYDRDRHRDGDRRRDRSADKYESNRRRDKDRKR